MPRNPFGLPDVRDPFGQDVVAFAERVLPTGVPDGNALGVRGRWSGRWCRTRERERWQSGVARVVEDGDRVFLLYSDAGDYLIESRRERNHLIGRYQNLHFREDSTPWVGAIANDQRIYGLWARGRWDFSRQPADPGRGPGVGR